MNTDCTAGDFSWFLTVLFNASEKICESYFYLYREGKTKRYRERVYCYELYHQMRVCMKDNNVGGRYTLNGELDKAGKDGYGKLKPDFIVHKPRCSRWNLAVMEVKPIGFRVDTLVKDLKTIKVFLDNRYCNGICLIYGDGEECRIIEKLSEAIDELRFDQATRQKVRFAWHEAPKAKARLLTV